MKKSTIVLLGTILLLAVWVNVPTTASAQSATPPGWSWPAHQNVVKAFGDWVWIPPVAPGGEWTLRPFNAVKNDLENAGWCLSHWSVAGGGSTILYYFTRSLSLFSIPAAPVQEYYQRRSWRWGTLTS